MCPINAQRLCTLSCLLACSFDRNYILVDDLEFFMPRVKAQKAFETAPRVNVTHDIDSE